MSCPTASTNVCGTHNDASVFLGDQIVNYDPAWRVELCDKKCDIKCDINCDIECFHFLPLSLSPEPMLLCLQIEESDKWIKVTEQIPQAALFSYTITHCRILKDPKVSELLCGLFSPLSPFSSLFNSEYLKCQSTQSEDFLPKSNNTSVFWIELTPQNTEHRRKKTAWLCVWISVTISVAVCSKCVRFKTALFAKAGKVTSPLTVALWQFHIIIVSSSTIIILNSTIIISSFAHWGWKKSF